MTSEALLGSGGVFLQPTCKANAAFPDWRSPQFPACRWLLISLLLLAPLAFGAVQPWARAALVSLVVLTLVYWAVACARHRQLVIAWTPLYVPALLFQLLAASQLVGHNTLNLAATRDSFILECGYLILFVMTTTVFANSTPKQWLRFGQIVTLYTFLLATFAMMQFLTAPDKIYWKVVPRWGGYVFGPYVNHNHYAGLMEMLVALTAAAWISGQHPRWQWYACAATVMGLVSVVLSGSRTGVVCTLFEMALLLVICLISVPQHAKTPFSALGLLLASAAILAVWITPPETAARLGAAVHTQTASLADRMVMAHDGLRMFRAHPLTGVGLGGFETAYPRFQTLRTDFRIDHAHNDYVEILAETGILGGSLVMVAAGMFFFAGAGCIRKLSASRGSSICWLRLGAATGCLGMMMHSLFDFNLHIPANAAWFVVIIALVCAPLEPEATSTALAFPEVE
jgi:O-antigen ligase